MLPAVFGQLFPVQVLPSPGVCECVGCPPQLAPLTTIGKPHNMWECMEKRLQSKRVFTHSHMSVLFTDISAAMRHGFKGS